MASTKEHMEKALRYLKDYNDVYMAINELENALSHYKIEQERDLINENRFGLGSMVS